MWFWVATANLQSNAAQTNTLWKGDNRKQRSRQQSGTVRREGGKENERARSAGTQGRACIRAPNETRPTPSQEEGAERSVSVCCRCCHNASVWLATRRGVQ